MIWMGAKSITIVRAVTANFFFDCRAAEVSSDKWIRDVPWGVHNDAQDWKEVIVPFRKLFSHALVQARKALQASR
jgi:hypothetical protein